MLTRRGFLTVGSVGLLALGAGCKPGNSDLLTNPDAVTKHPNLSLADKARLAKLKQLFLGYPINMNTPPEAFFTWRQQLLDAGIGSFAYNNVGNPFKASAIPYNTHDFEREIVLKYGKLYAFPTNNIWGFLTNSGTDSNMHGMYMGRTLLKGRTGMVPKAYFTKEAHYSVQILRDLLGLEAVFVDTLPDGGMDPNDLKQKLAENPSHPALVVATIGTTFKGAIDQLDPIQDALTGHASYLHVDAALFGGYLPFTAHGQVLSCQAQGNPAGLRYDSLAVSCHKFFGLPSPAGIFLTTNSHFDEFNDLFSRIHNPEYIHHVPGTITCSRDAVKPAEFYFYTTPPAIAKLTEDAKCILQSSAYLMTQMQSHFPHWQASRVNQFSNTLFFLKPSERMVKKYSLATMHLQHNHKKQDYAHVVLMPHVNKAVLAEFLDDLDKDPEPHLYHRPEVI